MEPLHTFITSRELESLLPVMVAHLKPAEENAELRVGEATLWFRWEGKKSMAEISLWESGDCDVLIVEIASGVFHPFRHQRCKTKEEFFQMLRGMIATISQLEQIADPSATDNSGASPLRV